MANLHISVSSLLPYKQGAVDGNAHAASFGITSYENSAVLVGGRVCKLSDTWEAAH